MRVLSKQEIKAFQKEILDWYGFNRRELPWREVPDGTSLDQKAYRILVSEIMSQQTQISRVIPKYEAWVQVFPTVEHLAGAKTSEVLQYWSGLGYNRRALFLQKCAKTVVEKFAGEFPQEKEVLKTLPGIGEYTAAAVACFAFDQQVAVVDTNVRKVILTRFYPCHCEKLETKPHTIQYGTKQSHNIDCHASLAMTNIQLQEIADALLPKGQAYEWNQALMDYASAMLKKEKIVIPKQSKFKGSNRFYRGQIIKLLIAQRCIEIAELSKKLDITEEKCNAIIKGLEKDALIIQENGSVRIV